MQHHIQRKKRHPLDWHPADIKASLEKAGWSLRRLSMHHGLHPTVLRNAIAKPYPRAELIIATAIGVHPRQIWPSRYLDDGRHVTSAAREQAAYKAWETRRAKLRLKHTTASAGRNVSARGAK